MTMNIVCPFQKWIPLIHVLILVIGTLFSTISSGITGHISAYLPFVSETGAFDPAKSIFSLFLIMGSFIGCWMIFLNSLVISSNDFNENKQLHRINLWTCFIGVISMFGLAGVAAFPMTNIFWAHLLFAGLYFMGSAAYFICITYITYKKYGRSSIFIYRLIVSGAISVFLIFITFMFPISLKLWMDKNKVIPALKKPQDEGFTLIFISSILEWSIVITIILFILSFMKELKDYTVMITVIKRVTLSNTSTDERITAEAVPAGIAVKEAAFAVLAVDEISPEGITVESFNYEEPHQVNGNSS